MTRRLVVAVIAVFVAVLLWQTAGPPPGPACTWRTGLATEVEQGREFDDLPAETPFRASLHLEEPLHLYVFSHSIEDGTLLLWPSPALESDLAQPLPAGDAVLPGRRDGKELAWTSRSQILGPTTVVAFASRAPLPEFEALAPQVRRWSNTVFPDRSMLVTKPAAGAEAAGGPQSREFPDALLRRAVELAHGQSLPNGPMRPLPGRDGVWFSVWRFVERKSR